MAQRALATIEKQEETFPSNPNYILLGQGFTIPKKGTCKAWIGFVEEPEIVSSGTGCTSTDGTELTLSITSGTET
ncbi:MAG: hypothetical protein WA854_12500, partial [Candidatus Binataceae bacterium]